MRKVTAVTKRLCELVTIDNGKPEDSKMVVKLMQDYLQRTGRMPLTIDPTAPMLIARHRLTEELLGFLSMKPMPPEGKLYVENFHVVAGRLGRVAARALLERLYVLPMTKVCIVRADNPRILEVLAHYGMRVLGYYLEGPIHGAPQDAVAAAPEEAIV